MEGSPEAVKTFKQDPLFLKFSATLPSSGAIVDEIREEIPESVVSRYFGPKASKSGWKYAKFTTVEEASAIYDLWTRVYEDVNVPNKEITLQFARGLILQQTQPVNWAEFAARRQRYREALRETKKSAVKLEKSGEIVGVGNRGVTVLGKKRLQVGSRRESPLIPSALKLTPKEDFEEELSMGFKKAMVGKGKGLRGKSEGVSPSWVDDDMLAIQKVIESTEDLLRECRKELEESLLEVEGLEGQSRRATIMLSDRVVMLEDHEQELSKIEEQQSLLQIKIAEKEALLLKDGSVHLSSSLSEDKVQYDELSLSRALASKSTAHCSSVVLGCQANVTSIEGRLLESLERRKNVESRVSGLECLLVAMHEQLQKMNDGGGYAFFPRPLANNPEKPLSSIHILNACPVCGFWYNSNNFVPLCCGHTYHMFCLSQHAKTSSTCCFLGCKQEFSADTIAAVGIRAPHHRSSPDSIVKVEGVAEKDSGRLSMRLQTLLSGTKRSSSPIEHEAHVPRPAHEEGFATPASTARSSEPIGESPQRTECTVNVGAMRKRSSTLDQTPNSGGIDSSRPFSSDEPDLTLQNAVIPSQSSVTDDICGNVSASKCKGDLVCVVCKNKPSAVTLTACGHGSCFKCISGLDKCPLCMKQILGWVSVAQKSNARPSPFPVVGAAVKETDLGDNNDDGVGLVHWCNNDVFLEGGVRTVVGDLALEEPQEKLEEKPREEVTKPAAQSVAESESQERTFTRRGQKTVSIEPPIVSDVETKLERPATVYSKKRGRLSVNIETLNHTRVMERPLHEILVTAPMSVGNCSKARGILTSSSKKLRTGATRGNQVRLTVPAKFRD